MDGLWGQQGAAADARRKPGFGLLVLVLSSLTACGGSGGGSGGGDVDDPEPTPPGEPANLNVTVSLVGQGQIVSSPRKTDCFDRCTYAFEPAAGASLLAVPARGYAFAGWEGVCADPQAAVCVLPDEGELELRARFDPAPQDLSGALWREGDLHTHSDHSSDGSLGRQTLDDAAPGNMPLADIIGLAETLAVDFLPITDHRTYDQHYDPDWESDSVLLLPGEEANGRPHATVHGAIDTIDQNADVEGASATRVVQESIWLAHSQGAAWVTAHPDRDLIDEDGTIDPRADAVGIDLVEIWNRAENAELEIDYAENRWNAGYRFGIAGASDNHFKELWALGGTPARPSTEVLAPVLRERALIDGLRAGRTDVFSRDTASPRVHIEADFDDDGIFEVQAGEEVFVPAGTPGVLRVHLDQGLGSRLRVYQSPGRSAAPLADVVAAGTIGGEDLLIDIVAGSEPSWYRAEVRSVGLAEPASLLLGTLLGPYDLENIFQELLAQLRALSSPIFVSTGPVAPVGDALPPPDAGRDDGAEYALGARGQFAGFADAAFDAASGRLHVVAEVHDETDTGVGYSARQEDGRWLAPQPLADSDSARFPRLAVRGDDVAVVWQDERAGQLPHRPAIHLRLSHDRGASFGPDIEVRAVDGRAMHPDVALAPDGTVHVVWQEIRRGVPFDVWYAPVDASGVVGSPLNLSAADKSFEAASITDSRSARYPASVRPAIAVDAQGAPVVVWQDDRFDPDPLWTGQADTGEGTDPDDWQIAMLRIDGAVSEPQYLGAADAADRHPDVTVDAAGVIHVVWDSKALSSSGVNLRVLAASLSPEAAIFGEPAVVGFEPQSSARQPRLGVDADGTARLAWFDSRSADWRLRVMSAKYIGSAWSEVRLIDGRGLNTWPVPAGPYITFSSTRNARRQQRDRTQQIYVLGADTTAAITPVPVGE